MRLVQNVAGIVRLLCVVTVVGLLGVASTANAAAPTTMWYVYQKLNLGYFSSQSAACSAWASSIGMTAGGAGSKTYTCVYTPPGGSPSETANTTVATDQRCSPSGTAPDTTKPLAQQCADTIPTACAGYSDINAAVTAYQLFTGAATCTPADASGIGHCTGSLPGGKQDTVDIQCFGKTGNTSGDDTGLAPKPVPSPPPQVDVNYPKCPAGTYEYVDIDGTTSCSITGVKVSNTTSCGSLNYGSINGVFVCLPDNPAPATAKAAADSAQSKADTAKNNPATTAATDAARGAAADAQKAADAANSMPSSTSAKSDAARAAAAAGQAAGYAGMPYTPPKLNGTGSGDSQTPCGSASFPCKIDESGTPDGKGAFDGAKSSLDSAATDYTSKLDQVTGESGKDVSWGWLPQLPQGTCTPLQFGLIGTQSVTVDWCHIVPTLKEITSWMLAFLTVLSIIYMVHGAIKGGS